jgi:hypothetical protein
MCPDQQLCGHDFDNDPPDSKWREYCPNTETLDALALERSLRRVAHGRRI